MCGLAGQVGAPLAPDAAARASRLLRHRGPDDAGEWRSGDGGVTLVHRRLAIRDLAPTGAQPMMSESGTHVLAYNGELYALDGLRRRLGNRRLRGSSDTEVLVEACAEWGVDRVLPELVGMFAFALWDDRGRELTLVRDRLGIKPLYWSHVDGVLRFASELDALRALGGPTGELDMAALTEYLRLNHLAGDRTPYLAVRRLHPGELLRHDASGRIRLERWWEVGDAVRAAMAAGSSRPEAEGLESLEDALRTSVRDRLVADVPLGSLLSGGIDSSLVTALAAEAVPGTLRTFSVGFADPRFDESTQARAVAAHLGTDHTELQVTEADALAVVPELQDMFGEPFGDASAIPTALVSRLARRHVTVVLSGDGGDEVFGGYPRYWRTRPLLRVAALLPSTLRPVVAGALGSAAGAADLAPRLSAGGRWLRKAGAALGAPDPDTAYQGVLSQWDRPARLLVDAPAVGRSPSNHMAVLCDPLDRMQVADLGGGLPDDILTKVDRASMRVGLEARVPLLDHRVIAAAWSLPRGLRVADRTGKVALRRLLDRRVPSTLWDRPKQGFSVPLGAWLRGPLRPWAEDLLAPEALTARGVLAPGPVRTAWDRHLAGADLSGPLWGVLMLQAWLDRRGPVLADHRPGHHARAGA